MENIKKGQELIIIFYNESEETIKSIHKIKIKRVNKGSWISENDKRYLKKHFRNKLTDTVKKGNYSYYSKTYTIYKIDDLELQEIYKEYINQQVAQKQEEINKYRKEILIMESNIEYLEDDIAELMGGSKSEV